MRTPEPAKMTDPRLIINNIEFHMKLGVIQRTELGYEDHGIFTALLHLDYGGAGQGVGGYGLDRYNKETQERDGMAYGLDHIMTIMEVVGVRHWEGLVGLSVYAIKDGPSSMEQVVGIANAKDPINNYVIFKKHWEIWEGKEPS